MTKNHNYTLGAKVIVINYNDLTQRHRWTRYDGVVTMVGRKYVTIELSALLTVKCDLETGISADKRYRSFATRNDFVEFHNTYRLRERVKREINKQHMYLSYDKLKQMAELLDVDWRAMMYEDSE